MQTRPLCENTAGLEALAENTGDFADFREKEAAGVEGLAENTRDFDAWRDKGVTGVEVLAKKVERGFV